jgi:hypothetical protein
LEAEELMLVFGERNDVVLVLKNDNLRVFNQDFLQSQIDKQITKGIPNQKSE